MINRVIPYFSIILKIFYYQPDKVLKEVNCIFYQKIFCSDLYWTIISNHSVEILQIQNILVLISLFQYVYLKIQINFFILCTKIFQIIDNIILLKYFKDVIYDCLHEIYELFARNRKPDDFCFEIKIFFQHSNLNK